MADSASSLSTLEPPKPEPNSQPDPTPLPLSASQSLSPEPVPPNPNPNPPSLPTLPPPPPRPIMSYTPAPPQPHVSGGVPFAPPVAPSFRPLPPQAPQFSPLPVPGGAPNVNYQNPSVQPPGVSSSMSMPMMPMQPMMPYQVPMRPYGYAMPPQGTMPPSGIPRYPPPYGMVRPLYPPRAPGSVNVLPVPRLPVAGVPAVRPVIPPVIRPVIVPSVTPAEKPQITVYIGKIAPTVENDFMLNLFQLCGPVKSWKRPQDLSNGTPKGFGFCEFESDEGVLRALRLLTKLSIDGQELTLNVNSTMKEYLKQYVEKKAENSKKNETQAVGAENDDGSAQPPDANGDGKPDAEHSKKEDNDSGNKESHDLATFGIITADDREADKEAIEKITNMIEERLKTRPLPIAPAQAAGDGSAIISEQPAKTRDGDTGVDMGGKETTEDKIEKDTNNDSKPTSDHDKAESPDRRHDRRSRERDRDRDLKREKERELDRYEREAERERIRKERELRRRIDEAERKYEACLKEWEYREREKEKERQYEKEKEKERERKRRKDILYDEEDEDDASRKRWRRSALEERRKKRLREKEDDLVDKLKEEQEIAEAKKRAEDDHQQKQQRDALKILSDHVINGGEKVMAFEVITNEAKIIASEQDTVADYSGEGHIGDVNSLNGINDESAMAPVSETDVPSGGNAPSKKLGFGLVGSGKRTNVPSVFHEEEDDDAHKNKKLRPLVPIDYSTEELQAVQPTASGPTPPNLAAAAEFAKRISSASLKEEKLDGERGRSRRSNERSAKRDRDKSDEDGTHDRDESREKIPDRDRDRDHGSDKLKTSGNKRLLDAKQLIDMIPKTKMELFSYEINWAVYDKNQLHERMRPWISKKIQEFLGEEENTLIDYIVSSTQEHVKASQMLERLQMILDEEAEMFVLKMWRMLIFEIKKVETGLALRSK
ncbi:unnamed protein product [Lupinus luteus]|uniref:RNA-binding protein 25 n=1 Tax=Lupinus luteus TaxID=3873 RepID=A0AAV1WU61_LUPLU